MGYSFDGIFFFEVISELAGLVIKLRRKLIGSVPAATAKDVELLKQQDTRFYPTDWVDVFVPNVAFGIDTQVLRLKLGEIVTRAMINVGIRDTQPWGKRNRKPF